MANWFIVSAKVGDKYTVLARPPNSAYGSTST
jgi:hypothetical protein